MKPGPNFPALFAPTGLEFLKVCMYSHGEISAARAEMAALLRPKL